MNSVCHRIEFDDQILLAIRDIKNELADLQGVSVDDGRFEDVLKMCTETFCVCKDNPDLSHHIDKLLHTLKTVHLRFLSMFISRLYLGNMFAANLGEITYDLCNLWCNVKHCKYNSREFEIYAGSDDCLYLIFQETGTKFFFGKPHDRNEDDIQWALI